MEGIIPWEECQDCDEFICNIHQEHVHDCACPGIDDWVTLGHWPYYQIPLAAFEALKIQIAWYEDNEID